VISLFLTASVVMPFWDTDNTEQRKVYESTCRIDSFTRTVNTTEELPIILYTSTDKEKVKSSKCE